MTTPTEVAAQSALGGGVALFIVLTGLDPQAVVWGVMGSTVGVVFSKSTGRFYGFFLFFAAAFISALSGTVISDLWFSGGNTWRNFATALVGVGFHQLIAAGIAAIPVVMKIGTDWLSRRFGGGQ